MKKIIRKSLYVIAIFAITIIGMFSENLITLIRQYFDPFISEKAVVVVTLLRYLFVLVGILLFLKMEKIRPRMRWGEKGFLFGFASLFIPGAALALLFTFILPTESTSTEMVQGMLFGATMFGIIFGCILEIELLQKEIKSLAAS